MAVENKFAKFGSVLQFLDIQYYHRAADSRHKSASLV